ncbi:MAG: homocysteine S-methyltransferase family protein, partial [Candidatus Kariarchaeaceae archaeon]
MTSRLSNFSGEPLILDGPMGTEIDRRGGDTTLPLWSARALVEDPNMIRDIHIDYLKAGADIITTNTFRTQKRTLKRAGIGEKAEALTNLAAELAAEARKIENKDALIAGSISPLEDCYSPQLVPSNDILSEEHRLMAKWLAQNEIDIFLIETMNTTREAIAAVEAARTYDLPIWLSLTCDDIGNILGGETWNQLFRDTKEVVDVYLVNCTSLEGTSKALAQFVQNKIPKFGAYPNFGTVDTVKGWNAGVIPTLFEDTIKSWLELKPHVLGTCCGA